MSTKDKIAFLTKELSNAKDSLHHAEIELENLKRSLKEMTLGKQRAINELHESRQVNVRLSRRLYKERHYFSTQNSAFHHEMKYVKTTLKSMQKSLCASNRKLTRHLQNCARTRFRLGGMFFRMRSTKQWCEKQRNRYQRMCFQFAAVVREQNRYMQSVVDAKLSSDSISTCHRQYLELLTRCSQLLHENMNLRLLSANKQDEQEEAPGNVGVSGSPANEVLPASEEESTFSRSDEGCDEENRLNSPRQPRHSI